MIIIEPLDLWCIFRRTHLGFSVGWGLVWVCGYTWCPKISWLLVYILNKCLLHFDIAHINQLGIVWGTNLSEFDNQMTKTVEHSFKHRNCLMIITGFLPPKKLGNITKSNGESRCIMSPRRCVGWMFQKGTKNTCAQTCSYRHIYSSESVV